MVYKERALDPEQINEVIRSVAAVFAEMGEPVALAGGVALQTYGSPWFTTDVDFLAPQTIPKGAGFRKIRPLGFGGDEFRAPNGVKTDIIVRSDDYRELYEEALEKAQATPECMLLVYPEYLAAMKLAAGRDKDLLHLKWMLRQTRLLDLKELANLVYRFVGGRFGVDQLQKISDHVEFENRKGRRQDDEP